MKECLPCPSCAALREQLRLTIIDQANTEAELTALRAEVELWKKQSAFESEHREKYRARVAVLEKAVEWALEWTKGHPEWLWSKFESELRRRATGGVMTADEQAKWDEIVRINHDVPAIQAADAELKRLREAIEHHRCAIWGVKGKVSHDQDIILYDALKEG